MDSLEKGFDAFWEATLQWLPLLVGALLILIIGLIVASIVRSAVRKILRSIGISQRLYRGHGGSIIEKAFPDPEGFLAAVAYWAVILGTVSLAVSALGIEALTNFVAAVYSYLPNVLAAFVIFLVAGAVATGVSAFASRTFGDTATGKLVSTVVPVIVMAIATFMILDQLMIAQTIITITYAALLGSAALGLALAFGLGGRDVAGRMLETAYQKGSQNMSRMRADATVARERTHDVAQEARKKSRR